MSEHREQRIRERAYSLWEADGCPEGRHDEYWLRAEQSIVAEDEPATPDVISIPPL